MFNFKSYSSYSNSEKYKNNVKDIRVPKNENKKIVDNCEVKSDNLKIFLNSIDLIKKKIELMNTTINELSNRLSQIENQLNSVSSSESTCQHGNLI